MAFDVECAWGRNGLMAGLPAAGAVVIVDVLSFCTSVDIAVGRGAAVYPCGVSGEEAAVLARERGALLASRDRQSGYSLSPASLLTLPADVRLVLPSPNGAALSVAASAHPTYAGCLRNARAVAEAAAQHRGSVLVVAAGERWPDGSLRPGLEDWLGAGAIVHHLPGRRSPDAALAEAAFLTAQGELGGYLEACASGQELIERDCAQDVVLAAELNVSGAAPRLVDGAYQAQKVH